MVQFFPAIDHALLMGAIGRVIVDPDTLTLCQTILDSGRGVLSEAYDMVYFPGDDLLAAARPRGLPIGNLTSQFWANVYLNQHDHFVKRELRCRAYLRYVDDQHPKPVVVVPVPRVVPVARRRTSPARHVVYQASARIKAASLHRLAAHDSWPCTPRRTATTGLPNQPTQARLPRGTHG